MSNQEIEYHLKSLPYIFHVSAIRENIFSKDLIGFWVNSSSVIRKPATLQRMNHEIEVNGLPLTLIEDDEDYSLTRFRLMIKN